MWPILLAHWLVTPHVQAQGQPSVALAWDANPDPSVVGYRIYYGGASGVYTNMLNAGSATNLTVSNLLPGGKYFFAATDYDTNLIESDYSAEVTWTAPPPPPPPVTNFVLSVSVQQSSGIGNWTLLTNLPSFTVSNSGAPLFWRAVMNIQPQ